MITNIKLVKGGCCGESDVSELWEEVSVPTHPLKDGRWVAVIAEIRHNKTGVVMEYETNEILFDGEPDPGDYIWEAGNYSCDCNRRLFFARAAAKDENLNMDSDCGEGEYSVRVRNKRSGRPFYSEFE